jgi:hypothetical protein
MKRFRSIAAKMILLASTGIGLSACVAVAPEPAPYYAAPTGYYYYQPGYYAARPAYNSYYFYYEDRDRPGHRHHRGHRHPHRR